MINPTGVTRFYPSNSTDPKIDLASLSASTPSVLSNGFPLLLLSSYASPHQLHLSVPVKIPVSDLDCEIIINQKYAKSSRNYFNYNNLQLSACDYSVDIMLLTCG